jgi:hypothetical protein
MEVPYCSESIKLQLHLHSHKYSILLCIYRIREGLNIKGLRTLSSLADKPLINEALNNEKQSTKNGIDDRKA